VGTSILRKTRAGDQFYVLLKTNIGDQTYVLRKIRAGDQFYVLRNTSFEDQPYILYNTRPGGQFYVLCNTSFGDQSFVLRKIRAEDQFYVLPNTSAGDKFCVLRNTGLVTSLLLCLTQLRGTSLVSNCQHNVTRSFCMLLFCISSNHFIVTWVLILTQIVSEK
jgi:hypothetical protein